MTCLPLAPTGKYLGTFFLTISISVLELKKPKKIIDVCMYVCKSYVWQKVGMISADSFSTLSQKDMTKKN